jgi:hypothetical protein
MRILRFLRMRVCCFAFTSSKQSELMLDLDFDSLLMCENKNQGQGLFQTSDKKEEEFFELNLVKRM